MPPMDERNARPAGDATGQPDAPGTPTNAVAVAGSGKNRRRSRRPVQRAQPKQPQGAAEASMAPGLGSLNRNLKVVTEQLATAHRILGQVAAERDGLRQQLADLLGVPVEEIVVPSAAAPNVPHESGPQPDAAPAEAAEGRSGRIRRRLPARWRTQNSPRS